MEIKNQRQVWDDIAKEWYKFRDTDKNKDNPTQNSIFNFLKNQSGKVLDLGSGTGVYLTKIPNGKIYLVDFSKEMIKIAKEKAKSEKIPAEFLISDITNLPFEDNYFDSAIIISVLMCVEKSEDRERTIKELYRVLKPKSKALVNVWNKDSKWFKNSPKERYMNWRDKGKRYYYLYGEKEVHDLFTSTGFKIIKKFKPDKSIMFIIEKS